MQRKKMKFQSLNSLAVYLSVFKESDIFEACKNI